VSELVKILIQHAAKVFSDLPVEQKTQKQLFLEALPPEFLRRDFICLPPSV
jgi:hypothetical protein